MGSTIQLIPRCLGTSQSVRASNMPKSAEWALVLHNFWPFTTHSSPSCTAVVVKPARSEPLPGSLNSWHHVSSPVTIRANNICLSSSEAWMRIVGAASDMPLPSGAPTAPAAVSSDATTWSAHAGRPRPYHSTGQVGHAQPPASRTRRHWSSDKSGSQWTSIHARTCSATSLPDWPGCIVGQLYLGTSSTQPRKEARPAKTKEEPAPAGAGPAPPIRASGLSVPVGAILHGIDHVIALVLGIFQVLLGLARTFVELALLLELVIIRQIACGLLDAALCLVEILVHGSTLPFEAFRPSTGDGRLRRREFPSVLGRKPLTVSPDRVVLLHASWANP